MFLAARTEWVKNHFEQEEVCYLTMLAVHPNQQTRGIGAAMLDWSLERAGANGEKVLVNGRPAGKPLYLKKGFKELGEIVLGDSDDMLFQMPCLVWDPNTIS